jgi:hypothetical protein
LEIPPAVAEKHVNLAHVPEDPFPKDFHPAPETAGGGSASVDLGGQLTFPGQAVQRPRFVGADGQRLFGKHRFTGPQRRRRDDRVGVIRCGDDHSVKPVRRFVEHPAEIDEQWRLLRR